MQALDIAVSRNNWHGKRVARRRGGFTLIELMLVLAVIALVSFAAYPAFDAWFQSQKLGEGVDKVRTLWIKARVQAMEEGQPYRFAWEMNSGHFRLAPDDLENWPDLAGAANGPHLTTTGTGLGLQLDQVLPGGVQFRAGDGGGGGNGGWAPEAIIFLANGTAQILAADGTEKPETQVILADRSGQMRALKVRGLTGVVTMEAVGRP
jgi:prepilin-type N-terminal cleavage/methylation domain-containing protein